MDAKECRVAELKAKIASSKATPGLGERVKALEAELAKIQ